MILSHLHQRPLRNPEPGDDGAGTPPAPVEPTAAPSPEPTSAEPAADPGPASTPAPAEPAEPFASLGNLLDQVGKPEGAEPAATPAQARDPNGRFASTSQAAAGVAAPAAPAPAATPKPGDIDLTPPEGMSERAQARWSALTERVKAIPDIERRATEAQTALDSVRQLVNDSGLQSQEFTEMLEMGRLFKSGNPQEMQRALQQLDGLRADLAQRLGVEVPGVDALAAHPDLKNKVENMLMTREDALEIARLRGKGAQADTLTREQQEHQNFVASVQDAARTMEASLAKLANTPGHDAKLQHIHAYFQNPQNMQAFVTTYQPHQWEAALLLMYNSFVPPVAPTPAGPQPLRPSNTRAGSPVTTGPVTATSAVENAFSRIGL